MKAATFANVRTAEAARTKGMPAALVMALDGGAVMGLCVAGLGLIGMGGVYYLFRTSPDSPRHGDPRLRRGRELHRPLRAHRRRHLHQGRRRGRRHRGQGRGEHPRGRPPQPRRHRRQRGRQRRRHRRHGRRHLRELRRRRGGGDGPRAHDPDERALQARLGRTDETRCACSPWLLPLLLATMGLASPSSASSSPARSRTCRRPGAAHGAHRPADPRVGGGAWRCSRPSATHGRRHDPRAGAVGGGVVGLITDYYTSMGPVAPSPRPPSRAPAPT
jgi:hypothetical protein